MVIVIVTAMTGIFWKHGTGQISFFVDQVGHNAPNQWRLGRSDVGVPGVPEFPGKVAENGQQCMKYGYRIDYVCKYLIIFVYRA